MTSTYRDRIVGVFASILIAEYAGGQCQYEVTIIDAPSCGIHTPVTDGEGLNDAGHVVGHYRECGSSNRRAFLWTPADGFVTLELGSDVVYSKAHDITGDGRIVGELIGEAGQRGFIYDDEELVLLEPADDKNCRAYGTNEPGTIVVGQRTNGEGSQAYIWSADFGYIDLGLMGTTNTRADDVNEHGVVIGRKGFATVPHEVFIWEAGRLTLLGPVPGATTSRARGINNAGQVVGQGLIDGNVEPDVLHGFIWSEGQWTVLEPPPGEHLLSAYNINDLGHVVGNFCCQEAGNQAFIWRDGVLTTLTSLVIGAPDVTLTEAVAINNAGQILCHGNAPIVSSTTVLLTPANRPQGDVDIDCTVGFLDLLYVLSRWHTTDSFADLDGSGLVDFVDVLIILATWTS